MRPSLTSAEGRSFGDIATPLWIDAWQMDTVGIRPDPTDNKRKPAYINALFYKFDKEGADATPSSSKLHSKATIRNAGLLCEPSSPVNPDHF